MGKLADKYSLFVVALTLEKIVFSSPTLLTCSQLMLLINYVNTAPINLGFPLSL